MTVRALLLALFLMNGDVLIEVSFLGKALLTTRNWADKRPFSGMHSEMVEKIMPLSKEHLAIIMVTL